MCYISFLKIIVIAVFFFGVGHIFFFVACCLWLFVVNQLRLFFTVDHPPMKVSRVLIFANLQLSR